MSYHILSNNENATIFYLIMRKILSYLPKKENTTIFYQIMRKCLTIFYPIMMKMLPYSTQ